MCRDKRRPAEAQSLPKQLIYLFCRESTRNQASSFPQHIFKVCGIESQHKPDTDTWVFSSLTEQNNPGTTTKPPIYKTPQTNKLSLCPRPIQTLFLLVSTFHFGSHQTLLFFMFKKIHAYTNVNIWVVGSLPLATLMLSPKQKRWQFCYSGWSPVI